jgi:transcription initiation factor TFIIIB Brf1 subunit/transcription initiation factor TFIIB
MGWANIGNCLSREVNRAEELSWFAKSVWEIRDKCRVKGHELSIKLIAKELNIEKSEVLRLYNGLLEDTELRIESLEKSVKLKLYNFAKKIPFIGKKIQDKEDLLIKEYEK